MKEIIEISRDELIELIECQYRLAALERGGVDNWQWYGESCREFLDEYKNENKFSLIAGMDSEEAEEYLEELDFRHIAEFEAGRYEVAYEIFYNL